MKNTSDVPIKFHWRQTGTSDDENIDITPGEYKHITVLLTSARTMDYYIEGGGSVTVYLVQALGSGLVIATVTIADIRTTLLDSSFSTSDVSDAAIQGYIDMITGMANDAATMFANIRGYALNTTVKTNAIKLGAGAQVLYLLRNKGASTGLTQDRIIISSETADRWDNEYKEMLNNIQRGLVYGGN